MPSDALRRACRSSARGCRGRRNAAPPRRAAGRRNCADRRRRWTWRNCTTNDSTDSRGVQADAVNHATVAAEPHEERRHAGRNPSVPLPEGQLRRALHDPASGATAAIDAPEAAPVEAALKATGWKLTDILVTHHHADHTGGIAELKAETPLPRGGAAGRGREDPAWSTRPCARATRSASASSSANVIETPGHTARPHHLLVSRRQARLRRRHAVLDRLRPRHRGHAAR